MKRATMHGLLAVFFSVALPGCDGGRSTSTNDGPSTGTEDGGKQFEIRVVSSRADLVTGSDALIDVVLPADSVAGPSKVTVAGRDVSGAFARRANGRVMGLVDDLAVGPNQLSVEVPGMGTQQLTITNHPKGGPVFSGPHLMPWVCETEANGLGPATDDDCNAPTRFTFQYKPEGSDSLSDYDPDNPPDDVDTVTTDQGNTVPFIVRVERGTVNRGIYQIAILDDPGLPWEPWDPQPGWNGKLLYIFGASSGSQYRQASPPGVTNMGALSRGYAVASSSLNVNGNQSNHVLAAETMMMVKERLTIQHGEIRYTVGSGCSGGSIQQHRIANSYPGLLQGIQPNCSYPDTWTVRQEVGDCVLLNNYLASAEPALPAPLTLTQWSFASGYQTGSSCVAWEALFGANGDPTAGCGIPQEMVYDPETNPEGARCTSSDYEINIWGERPPEVWGPVEQEIGRGFGRLIFNNFGILYGLGPLQQGLLSPEQFLHLNENIGGKDVDWEFVPQRTDADPGAVEIAHRTGSVNDFSQMDQVAVIDLRGTSNNEIHTDFHSYAHRDRMVRAYGHHDNQVIWTFPSSIVLPPEIADISFDAIDRWLTAIESDTATGTLAEKVARNRPSDVVDQCWVDIGMTPPIADAQFCSTLYPHFGAPRIAAGMSRAHDIVRCQLAELPETWPNDGSYGQIPFLDAQWDRLRTLFPEGVCDYSVRHPDDQRSIPWLDYSAGPGGEPLGPEPVSR